eukprot:TRINITY_DN8553_c0_g1_i1.p1 TRINITY_DN8553_c0_g1~~TRINITY_DN8553_c0_g1_i1.p1  ORF type:complete len:421 (-),score=64.90 TRINITY_DN8553_c0_g1_i1:125-1387(-)
MNNKRAHIDFGGAPGHDTTTPSAAMTRVTVPSTPLTSTASVIHPQVDQEQQSLSISTELRNAEAGRSMLTSSFARRAEESYDFNVELHSPLVTKRALPALSDEDVSDDNVVAALLGTSPAQASATPTEFVNIRGTFGRERTTQSQFSVPHHRDPARIRILLVRHGESLANVDPLLYTRISDHAVPLSQRGVSQAKHAGAVIRDHYKKHPLPNDSPYTKFRRVWVSPYKRARETAQHIFETAGDCIGDCKESVFLGEHQFGLFEGLSPKEVATMYPHESEHFEKAIKFGGRFWARTPLGESRYDVASRVSRLFDRILLDQQQHGIEDVIIVAHGTTVRAFAMMWLNRTPEWFEKEANAENCSIRLLKGLADERYVFNGFGRGKDRPPTCNINNKLDSVSVKMSKEEEEQAIRASRDGRAHV